MSETPSTARQGKVARLPLAIREEINRRLLDGETGRKILPWLNTLPEVKAILTEDFEGLLVNDDNLSAWRKGGYADWLRRREMIARTQDIAQFSLKLGEAAGADLSAGNAAVLSGCIMQVLEEIQGLLQRAENETPEQRHAKLAILAESIENLTGCVAQLRKGDQNKEKLTLIRARLTQTADQLKLAQAKFQRETLKAFIQWYAEKKSRDILDGGESDDAKTELLGKQIFGENWQ